jgi:hypothetical protein
VYYNVLEMSDEWWVGELVRRMQQQQAEAEEVSQIIGCIWGWARSQAAAAAAAAWWVLLLAVLGTKYHTWILGLCMLLLKRLNTEEKGGKMLWWTGESDIKDAAPHS